ncbi:ABC transporter ATP-binding protein [Bosea sp. TAF32]|uniref:ABC transporter ATP-binding protein n=1 Tax=Bosea sp. TAF32 TaxID=3237482 RepID=UPI003F8F6858
MTQLVISDVSKRYGAIAALDRVSLAVEAGRRVAIVGPSGSGKTTLLRVIAGFEAPDAGTVVLDGQVLADGPAIAPAHRRRIGYVAQDGALFPHLDVAGNVGFGIPRNEPDRAARLRELMELVELDPAMLERRPHELSGGQQQRVALARALARKPALMLLDEPFSALDTGLRESVRQAVARVLAKAGITTILVTHDQGEALSFADQLAVMREGRLVQTGRPAELYWRPADVETALFLGNAVLFEAEIAEGSVSCGLGEFEAETGGRRGAGTIMLRPEQFLLSPVGPGHEAFIENVAFRGAQCTVTLRTNHGGGGIRFTAQVSSMDRPQIGQTVFVSVKGEPFLLPGSR